MTLGACPRRSPSPPSTGVLRHGGPAPQHVQVAHPANRSSALHPNRKPQCSPAHQHQRPRVRPQRPPVRRPARVRGRRGASRVLRGNFTPADGVDGQQSIADSVGQDRTQDVVGTDHHRRPAPAPRCRCRAPDPQPTAPTAVGRMSPIATSLHRGRHARTRQSILGRSVARRFEAATLAGQPRRAQLANRDPRIRRRHVCAPDLGHLQPTQRTLRASRLVVNPRLSVWRFSGVR